MTNDLSTLPSSRDAARRAQTGPLAIALWTSGSLLAALAIADPHLRHWSLLPIACCAALLGVDVVRVARGEISPFEPRALVGVFGTLALGIIPALHIRWNQWSVDFRSAVSIDERSALGWMAALTAVGLVAMRVTAHLTESRRSRRTRATWSYTPERSTTLHAVIALALLVQTATLISVGGPGGFVEEVNERSGALRGLGPALALGESTPILITIYVVLRYRERLRRATTPFLVIAAIILVLAVFFLFGGLRGSRSTAILMVVACIGIFDLWVRPISRKALVVAAALGFVFMVGYGQYKSLGSEAAGVLQREGVSGLTDATGRDWASVLLGDFGRADVQATLLHKHANGEIDLVYGRTYVGNAAFLVMPRVIFPDRPVGKVQAGTDALLWPGAYEDGRRASRIYGLGGEALINFGPIGVPAAYAVFGLWLGTVSGLARQLDQNDLRRILIAPLAILSVVLLVSDTDNALWATVKYVAVPALALRLCRKRSLRPKSQAAAVSA